MLLSAIISLVLVFIILIAVYVLFMSRRHGSLEKRGFVGPKNINRVIGSKGTTQSFIQTIIEFYREYKHHGAYAVYATRFPSINVASLDIIKDITGKHFNKFSIRHKVPKTGNNIDHSLISLDGEQWKRVRRTLSSIFSSTKLKQMSPLAEGTTRDLVKSLVEKQESGEPVELKDFISLYTIDTIAKMVFGEDINCINDPGHVFAEKAKKYNTQFLNLFLYDAMFPFLFYLPTALVGRFIAKDVEDYFHNFVDRALEKRRNESQSQDNQIQDFVQLIMQTEQENDIDTDGLAEDDKLLHSSKAKKTALSSDQMHAAASSFILAGYDTTSTTISFTLFLLAMNDKSLEKAQQEIDQELGGEFPNYQNIQQLAYLEQCVNEGMRLHPAAVMTDRECVEDVTIQNVSFKRGDRVMFPLIGIFYDPDIYPEPEKFDPERFSPENKSARHPCAFLPFGLGPRNCIGQRLGLLEVKLCLAAILQRFKPVRCDKSVYPIVMHEWKVVAKSGLWVKFEQRK